jgi:copper chaperone
MAHQLSLKISGMHCGACVRRLSEALEKLPDVEIEDVQVGSARLRISGGKPDKEAVLGAIRKTGFELESEEEAL